MNGKIFFLAALIALATGCAFTGANRKSPDGQSDWSAHGVSLFETPADGYAKTAAADATLLFAQTVAQQRAAIVAGAYAAAQGDRVAREEIVATQADLARTKRAVNALAGAVEAVAGADEGGVR